MCCLAMALSTGGFSPGRTPGPVVSGPVRAGEAVGAGADEDEGDEDGDIDGDGAPEVGGAAGSPWLVQLASSTAAAADIARDRRNTSALFHRWQAPAPLITNPVDNCGQVHMCQAGDAMNPQYRAFPAPSARVDHRSGPGSQ